MPTNLNKRNLIDRRNDTGPMILVPIIILLAVITAATYAPALGLWISDAAQAEFVGSDASTLFAEAKPQSPQVALSTPNR